jgi:SAM-dependent methyltransferase
VQEMRQLSSKTPLELAREWDQLAAERHRQISSGDDISFEHVLVPTALDLLKPANTAFVVDIGSGTGDFTARLAQFAREIVGIEPSHLSVALARKVCRNFSNVSFFKGRLEDASETLSVKKQFTAAVASMTLMTTLDLQGFAHSLAKLLLPGAKFVATITHPCFWPRYWGYEERTWFDYRKEIIIEAPFKISRLQTNILTTHVHRPLDQYVNVFGNAGFKLEALAEPMPGPVVAKLYPSPWRFPRFMGLRWVKLS